MEVLFKPTKAAEMPFRPTRADAASYFVGGAIAEARSNPLALLISVGARVEPAGRRSPPSRDACCRRFESPWWVPRPPVSLAQCRPRRRRCHWRRSLPWRAPTRLDS